MLPTIVLVCIIDVVLQDLLLAIELHLPVEQRLLILSMFLLTLINCIEPQVETREVGIHVLLEMGFIEARRTHLSANASPPRVVRPGI